MTVKISVLFEGGARKTALYSPAAHIFCPGKAKQAKRNANQELWTCCGGISRPCDHFGVGSNRRAPRLSTVQLQRTHPVDVPSEKDTIYGIIALSNKIGKHRFMPLPQPFDKPVSTAETKSSALFSYADAWPAVDYKPVYVERKPFPMVGENPFYEY